MTWSHNIAAKTEREVLALERIADALEKLVQFQASSNLDLPDGLPAESALWPLENRSGIKTRRTKQRRKRGCRRLAKPVEINETEEIGNGKRQGAKDRRISGERRDNHGSRRKGLTDDNADYSNG